MRTPVEHTEPTLPRLVEFLECHASTSLFLLENLRSAGLAEGGSAYSVGMEGGAVTGVASMNSDGFLLVQAPRDAALLSADVIRKAGKALRGILGPSDQVAAVLAGLGLSAVPVRMHSDERLYELGLSESRESVYADDFVVRPAVAADVAILSTYRRAYRIEALGAMDDASLDAAARHEAERMARDGATFVLANDEEIVAMTLFSARHRGIVQVGGVFTPSSLRSRGYGRRVVAGSLVHAKKLWGAEKAVLFTAQDNIAAQWAYESLGFRATGQFTLHFFREPVAAS